MVKIKLVKTLTLKEGQKKMGFEIYPSNHTIRTRSHKILVCEREVKDVHFTIVDDTAMRMTTAELDNVAQIIHDEIKELKQMVTLQIFKKVVMDRTEVFCVANGRNAHDWTIKVTDPLQFVC